MRLRQDRPGFLASLMRQEGFVITAAGDKVPRLPSRVFWLDDGEFCGVINLRFVPGSDQVTLLTGGEGGCTAQHEENGDRRHHVRVREPLAYLIQVALPCFRPTSAAPAID